MTDPQPAPVLWEAEFDPRVRTYWLMSGALLLAIMIVGLPLLPFWFVFGHALTGRYLRRMRCVLTEKTFEFGKGVLVRTEKTIPLDKITDLGLVQGPLMRFFGLEALSIETAGQSAEGPLVKLVGIVETRRFRSAVLEQRDRLVAARAQEAPAPAAPSAEALLTEIRDTLARIEHHLKKAKSA